MSESAEVTFPNGRKATITGPTREAVLARIDALRAENQPEATNAPSQADGNEIMRGLAADLSTPEALLVAGGSAVNDVRENLDSMGQFIGEKLGFVGERDRARLEKQQSLDDDAFRALRDERPVATAVGRTAAQIGMFAAVPGGASGNMAVRMLSGMFAGAGTAGLSTGVDEDLGTNMALGGAFGASAPVVMQAVSKAISKLAKKPIQTFVDGQLTDEAIELLEKADISPELLSDDVARELQRAGAMNADEAKTFNLFKQFDDRLEPTRAQVTQSGDDFMRQQELAKTSNAVSRSLDEQEKVIADNVDAMIEGIGSRSIDDQQAGARLLDTAFDRINAADEAVDSAYKAAREAAPTEKAVSLARLQSELKKMAGQDRASNGFIRAIASELKARGITGGNRVSVETAEEVRKVINQIAFENPATRARLARGMKNALDDDVAAAVGDDVFKPARQAKAQLERSLERARKTRRSANRRSLVENLIEERVDPRQVLSRVETASADDLKQLMSFYRSGSKAEVEAGEQAINELRSSLIRRWFIKASSGKTEGGHTMFSGPQFKKAVNSFGADKMEALFTPEQQTWVGQLIRIGELRMPKTGTALGLGPSGAGARQVADIALQAGDMKTGGMLTLVRKLTEIAGETKEVRSVISPGAATAKAVRDASRVSSIGRRLSRSGAAGAAGTSAVNSEG